MISRSVLIRASFLSVALFLGRASAQPTLYSSAIDTHTTRLQVTSPKAGLYKAGDELTIRWKKSTEGKDATLFLYSASAEGLRDKKLRAINPSD
jgi:hypothetical protein